MRVARVQITAELLAELLVFPPGTEIWDARWVNDQAVELTVRHRDLPDVTLGTNDVPPLVKPTYRAAQDVQFEGWE